MIEIIKSGYLDQIFTPRSSSVLDYSFLAPSYTGVTDSAGNTGYVIFNNETGVNYQYSGGRIYSTGNPGVTYSELGAIPPSLVSGSFNGKTKIKTLGSLNLDDFSAFIVFQHSETGIINESKVLFSTKGNDSSVSGYTFGINGCNRLFFEHNTPSSGKRVYTLEYELDNKNLASISKIESGLQMSLHQFDDYLNKFSVNDRYNLVDYAPSDTLYVGGLGASGAGYRNFSGQIDSLLVMNRGLEFPERNVFSQAFFCSGYQTGFYDTVSAIYNTVTGAQYQDVIVGTGITGYVEVSGGTIQVGSGTVTQYVYSGVTGYLYSNLLIELTGAVTGQSDSLLYNPPSGLYNYGYVLPFANSKVVLNADFDSSYKEVYSFSGRGSNDLNVIPAFSRDASKFSILSTGSGENINFYVNGLVEPYVTSLSFVMTGDFVVSGDLVDSDAFFDSNDVAIYDIIYGSGSLTGITSADVASGTKSIPSSFVNSRDLFLNGSKLISGIHYSGVGANVVISTTDLIDGDLLVLPKHTVNLSRYTGLNDNNFNSSLNLFDEQVYVNGLRQLPDLDYLKVSDFSLKYSSFSLAPQTEIVYNNYTGNLNV